MSRHDMTFFITKSAELYEAMNKKQAATTAVKEAREDAKKLRSDVNDK